MIKCKQFQTIIKNHVQNTHTHTQYIYNRLILKERKTFVGKTYVRLKTYFCKISKFALNKFFGSPYLANALVYNNATHLRLYK